MNRLPLLAPTKARILSYLLHEKRTTRDIASALNIQGSAARKHLERLVNLGLVSEEYARRGVGRPRKYYSLTERGEEVFPRQYDMILNAILTRIAQFPRYAESIMKSVATDLACNMLQAQSQANVGMELRMTALNDFGFEVSYENAENACTVVSRNCPLRKAASDHQGLVCLGLHDELLKAILGVGNVTLEQCIVRGDKACRHVARKPA